MKLRPFKSKKYFSTLIVFVVVSVFLNIGVCARDNMTLLFFDRNGNSMNYRQVAREMNNGSSGWECDMWLEPSTLKVITWYPMSDVGNLTFPMPSQPAAFAINWKTLPNGYGYFVIDNGGNGFSGSQTVNWTYQAAKDIKLKLDAALAARSDYTWSSAFSLAYNSATTHLDTANGSTVESIKGKEGQLALDDLCVAYDLLLKEYGPQYAAKHKAETTPIIGVTIEVLTNYQAKMDNAKSIGGDYAWARIVFQDNDPPSDYQNAIDYAESIGLNILGCPVDSTLDGSLSTTACINKHKQFIDAFPSVDAWEVGNEVNGGWSSSDIAYRVEQVADYAKSKGKTTYLCLFWQIGTCDPDYDLFTWIDANLTSTCRSKLDYVQVSQYQEQAPMGPIFDQMMLRMQEEFPNAKIGLAELGYWISGQRYWWAYNESDPQAGRQAVCEQYYNASLGYANSAGGCFWWNYIYKEWDSTMNNTLISLQDKLDFTYTDNGDNSVTITGYTGSDTEVVIPSSIDGKAVTAIGESAFRNKMTLTSITIPDSVTSIGYSAFAYCQGLTSMIIPDSVTVIRSSAFHQCSELTSVTIGNNVTTLEDYAFSLCSGLTSISLPDSVTSIGNATFQYCSGLTSVSIGNGVASLGEEVFLDCTGLTSIDVDVANPNYSSLGGVLFNKTQTELIQYTIGNARTSYTIPNGVTTIGDGAFKDGTLLTSVTIGDNVQAIASHAFEGCTNLTSITIPNSVTSIESYAFDDTGLTSITIPNSMTNIADWTFSFCSDLTSITIPDSVTGIGAYAFYQCTNLTSVTIPNGVTTIGEWAFYGCTALTSAIFTGDAPESFGNKVFNNCAAGFKIYYYQGATGFSNPWNGYTCEEIATYALTVNSGTGSGSYAEGTVVSISATVPANYSFVNWTGDVANIDDVNDPTTTVTMPASAVTITASFASDGIRHSADTNGDWSISQSEVNAFIGLYNNNDNSVSGDNGSFDNANRITMREVIRVIYLYNGGGTYKGGQTTIDTYDVDNPQGDATVPPAEPIDNTHTFVCANSADSGVGSFRNLIANAADGDTITFDESIDKITLASEIVIDKSITIDGNGITIISGDSQTRIFRVYNENEDLFVLLLNIGIVDANNSVDKFGGAIYNNGENLTVENCLFSGNKNFVADGQGGAIYTSGTLRVINSVFSDNSATEENNIYSTNGEVTIE